jgi:hypothetical protein
MNRRIFASALLVLFALVAVRAEDPETEGDVLILTDKNFDSVRMKKEPVAPKNEIERSIENRYNCLITEIWEKRRY